MPYIGQQPAPKVVTSSDLADDVITADKIGDTAISGFSALTSEPADTDEFLISDNGVLKRLDASLIGGGGKLLQVVQTTTASTDTISGGTLSATTITANITPASSSNKILIFASSTLYADTNTAQAKATIYRGSTNLAADNFANNYNSAGKTITPFNMQFLDSPNTTSQTTYTVYGSTNSGNAIFNGPAGATGVMTLMEIQA